MGYSISIFSSYAIMCKEISISSNNTTGFYLSLFLTKIIIKIFLFNLKLLLIIKKTSFKLNKLEKLTPLLRLSMQADS